MAHLTANAEGVETREHVVLVASVPQLVDHRPVPVFAYLDDVCELDDPRQRGKALTANLAGYWCYRVRDGREVVEIRGDELVMVALGLRHPLAVLPGAVSQY